MSDIIKSRHDLCTGCNRCVRECPMETANITYQDADGNTRVKIDHEKCITCGRCLSACKHNARYYEDDTGRFFDDLKNGAPISVIAAPAICTNIPEWKNLFTYLKQLGAGKIYDVSLGADICVWGYIRHIQQSGPAPLITQPCPAIVTYCETYRQDLLESLSPVHSPMACAAIYMREYEGVTGHIAALSPCVAKANEFRATGLAQYNITFAKLKAYIEENGIELPEEQTGFDHEESGLGALFPMPGGLKENIEFFLGKELSIDKAEGRSVFGLLDTYAASPAGLLPQVFDVLNCQEGCNLGTACSHSSSVFAVNRAMDGRRRATTEGRDRAYFDALYKRYDDTFSLPRFLRAYKPAAAASPRITEADIEAAFGLLGKDDDAKRAVDCGACGSDTCRGMARKIALGVNIPRSCMVKAMEDSKEEHAENIAAREQLAIVGKTREADERMRIMLDAMPMGAHFWDEDMNIVDCNQAAVKLFNLKSKQEYIDRYFDLIPDTQPDGVRSEERLRQMIDQTFAKGLLRVEWMRRTLDGEPIPVEMTMVRVEHKGKDLIAGYFRDLREHKRMLQEINAAKFTTSAMFESNPQINVLFDAQFNAVDCNPAAVAYMGFATKEEMLAGFTARMIQSIPAFQPDGRASIPLPQRFVTAAREGLSQFETELVMNGVTRNISVELIRIPYESSFAIVAYVFDMTDLHLREMELARARELNELQLAKLTLSVRASKIALWDMDVVTEDPVSDENTLTWSQEFRHMLGFTDENDFPNTIMALADRLHPDESEKVFAAFAAFFFDRAGRTPYDLEYRLQKKNGDYAYFHASAEIIRDENGFPLRVAGSLIDITESKNILLDTERQRVEAEAANRAKSAFLSTMSHEIRTPMNAILGITEIQLQNDMLDANVRESLEKIYTSGDLLLGIINDILDLSKIEAGKLELIPGNYEIASMISDTAQLNMMRIGSKEIEFALHVDENLPTLMWGDELRVKQILNNLLSNAFKYTDEGTVDLSFAAEDSEEDGTVDLIIRVSDTGQGMSKDQVSKLFDEYSRFNQEANRTTEGTGLGMSITRNLIKMMNGEIFIDSEAGRGSVFTVRLPQGRVASGVLGREMAENLHKFRTSSRAQMRRVQITREPMPYGSVLVVDDVETNIFVAKGLLSPYGLRIESTDSGYGAIEKIKHGKAYDVIFMDHMMPKMDGVEATKLIRGMGYQQPIVALTANAVSGQADVFLGNGFDDFISKPIDVRQLNAILNKFIRDKQPPEVIEAARRQAEAKSAQAAEGAAPSVLDPEFAKIFIRDAKKSLDVLEAIAAAGGPCDEETLRTYVIHVHGMKSALANIGKTDLSAVALKLEQSGRDGNAGAVKDETPAFLAALRDYIGEITPEETAVTAPADEDKDFLREKLQAVIAACEDYDTEAADNAIAELRQKPWSPETGERIGTIAEHLLHSDFDEAAAAAKALL